MRVAEEYDDDGNPIYTTTVKLVVGQIMETDIEQRNADMQQATQELQQHVNVALGPPPDHADLMISDAFFNCEPVNDLHPDNRDEVAKAAEAFRQELPADWRERYTVDWLLADFYERL